MNRMKTAVSVFGAAALTMSLAACGGGDDFCDTAEQEFGSLDLNAMGNVMGDPDAAGEFADSARTVADAASGDAAEAWNTLADAMETLSEMDMSDPESMADVDMSALENLDQAALQESLEACA
ncbi:hypothetical protein G1H11_06620 [Phytoactinopolyspora alkaliphila]|uniref:Uncharacterized protein n=1 Tax=Phytoactinopolyspora alkaliphila TaxID=1783498 RepID=A0A6N9YJ08_9ACTN|nr:hypothetical protein [Phytoactinopolyspora alkaliphila]NED94983.1 hypothetical protein [Phytoactinopolyspora alkaliphila]